MTAAGRDHAPVAESSELYFDRTAPRPLFDAVASSGEFHDLVEAVRKHRRDPLDFQLRARPDVAHATLYLGLTKILDLHYSATRGFWLTGQQKTKTFADVAAGLFDEGWARPQSLDQLDRVSRERRAAYIDAIVAATRSGPASRYVGKEGALQARLAHFPEQLVVIDREVVVGFSAGGKEHHLAHARSPVAHAIDRLRSSGAAWTFTRAVTADQLSESERRRRRAKRFGNELDAIALDAAGRLLAIEAKHGSDSPGGVGWTPAQVAVYVRLLRAWVDADSRAAETLGCMLDQRRKLGLAPGARAQPARPLRLVPAIVIGESVQNPAQANERMRSVHEALVRSDEPLEGLEVWQLIDGDLCRCGLGALT